MAASTATGYSATAPPPARPPRDRPPARRAADHRRDGIRRNRCIFSLRRCRKLRCRHPRGLWHRPIDRLGSLSLAANPSERPASGASGCRRPGAQGPPPHAAPRCGYALANRGHDTRAVQGWPSVDHQHRGLHRIGTDSLQGTKLSDATVRTSISMRHREPPARFGSSSID
jgi:hypothetical protein